ncbi:MAG: hypothetical protein WAO52_11280, partial [Prolixibacteraceae bacterium]
KTDKKDERQILLQLIKNGNPAKNILGRKISVNHRLYGQTLIKEFSPPEYKNSIKLHARVVGLTSDLFVIYSHKQNHPPFLPGALQPLFSLPLFQRKHCKQEDLILYSLLRSADQLLFRIQNNDLKNQTYTIIKQNSAAKINQ